jgi:hypothetical protein
MRIYWKYKKSCEIYGCSVVELVSVIFDLELDSPTLVFPLVLVVTIILTCPPLVVLFVDGLVDGVALTIPHDKVGEVVHGVLLPLVNLPLLSLCRIMHPTYHDKIKTKCLFTLLQQ